VLQLCEGSGGRSGTTEVSMAPAKAGAGERSCIGKLEEDYFRRSRNE